MIKRPTKMRLYAPLSQSRFDITTEPTIESALAESYLGEGIVAAGQVINAMDGYPNRFLTVGEISLITGDDSTFDSDTGNWVRGTGVTIAGGKLVFSGAGGDASITIPLTTADYEVIFTISGRTLGTVAAIVGGTAGAIRSTNATFTETITGGGTTTFNFNTDPSFDGSIDNVTVIGGAGTIRIDTELNSRQAYNAMILDGNNLLTSLPASMRRNLQLFYNSVDTFGSATEIVPTKVLAGLLGRDPAYLDFDGVDDGSTYSGAGVPSAYPLTLEIQVNTSFKTATQTYLFVGDKDATNEYINVNIELATGFAWMGIRDGGASTDIKGAVDLSDGEDHLIHAIYTSATDRELVVDGVSVGTSVVSATMSANHDRITIGNLARSVPTNYARGSSKGGVVYNRALSVPECLARFNGGEIAAVDMWGVHGITGFTNNASFLWDTFTTTGPVIDSAITDGDTFAVGYSNPIRLIAGETYNLLSTAILNSGTAPYILVSNSINGANPGAPDANNPVHQRITASDDIDFTVTVTQDYYIVYRNENGESSNNSSMTPIFNNPGAVASYQPHGISSDQSKWFDDSDNLLTGTISGAEVFNGPDSDNLGFILYEFDEISAINLFWFLQQNQDVDTALANIKDGWIPELKYFDFELLHNSGYGGKYAYPGSKTSITEGGQTLSESFFGFKPTFDIRFNRMVDADFENLQTVVDSIKGKLLPFYARFAATSEDGRVTIDETLWRLRMVEDGFNWVYDYGSDQPWMNITLRVTKDI